MARELGVKLGLGGGKPATSGGAPPAPAASPVTRQSDLVGWWKFNESSGTNAADSSVTGNTGTLQNMADSDWVAGKSAAFGNCLEFDGTDEYVSIPANGAYPTTGSFSVSAWLNSAGLPKDGSHVNLILQTVNYYVTGVNSTFSFFFNQTAQSLNLHSYGRRGHADDGQTLTSTNPQTTYAITLDNWHQVGFVYDASANTTQLYLAGATLGGTAAVNSSSDLGAGEDNGFLVANDRGRYFLGGKVDDVRIYGVALTSANMASIYGSGNGDWA